MVHSENFYREYRDIYLKYKDIYGEKVCVFLLKGHFWEFYGTQDPETGEYLDTVKEITDILGVKLTKYPHGTKGAAPEGKNGLFAGVPINTLDKWGGRLTTLGWTVVVMEEIRKSDGSVDHRAVTKILSPGTHIENADATETFFIGSLYLDASFDCSSPPRFGAAVSDLTTGQVFLYEGSTTGRLESWYADDLRHFFQVYRPRELVVFWNGSTCHLPSIDILKGFVYSEISPIHLKSLQETVTTPIQLDYLQSLFQPKTLLPFTSWLNATANTLPALYRLLKFSEDHAPSLAAKLQQPQFWRPNTHLHIINNALQQLNFITYSGGIGNSNGQQSIIDLFTKPYTAMGKRGLTARLCMPLASTAEIQSRLNQVEWIKTQSVEQRKKYSELLQQIYDLPRIHRSIIRGSIDASDILQLNESFKSCEFLYSALLTAPFENSGIKSNIEKNLSTLNKLFDVGRAQKANATPLRFGFVHESIAPKSWALEKEIHEIYSSADQWLESLSVNLEIPLQFKSSDSSEFMIQITNTQKKNIQQKLAQPSLSSLKSALTIKSLTSNARLEHAELDNFQKRLDATQQKFKRTQQLELEDACIQYIEATQQGWLELETWITSIDCTIAIAATAEKRGFVKPTLQEGVNSGITCKGLRHPLIEAQKSKSKLVPHDVTLGYGKESGWLLYGMNASGKSSLMKSIGIAVLLAQAGSYVPATSMELVPFQSLATRILNQDNLWAGLSSFAVEMSELREIFRTADNKTLVLGDELCSGTESVSATAIVAAGIQWLLNAKSRFVLATHLHDLNKFDTVVKNSELAIYHLRVEYNRIQDKLVYHRDLQPGPGTTLYGLEVAKALHLPQDLLEQAYGFRKQLLGSASDNTDTRSHWNSDLDVRVCESCGAQESASLEVHHIQERHNAVNGRNVDGTGLNDLRNLVVLCESCHDKHHANTLQIGPVIETSKGPERSIRHVSPTATAPPSSSTIKFSSDELIIIRRVVSENAGLSWKLMKHQIAKEGLEITEKELKSLRTNDII